jgi:hypothetical protein
MISELIQALKLHQSGILKVVKTHVLEEVTFYPYSSLFSSAGCHVLITWEVIYLFRE